MFITKAISIRVRQILKEKGITQYKLEQLTGIYHNTMTSLLNCRYKTANIITVLLIIDALDMTISEFFNSPLFDFNNLSLD